MSHKPKHPERNAYAIGKSMDFLNRMTQEALTIEETMNFRHYFKKGLF